MMTAVDGACRGSGCVLVVWRSCNVCMSLFFALAAYVQINDPDAGIWMVGYAVPAALCVAVGLRPQVTEWLPWRRIADLHLMVSTAVLGLLGWTLYKERITNVFQQEEGREFSGLMLTVIWLLLCRRSGRGPIGKLRVSTAAAVAVFPLVVWMYYYTNKDLTTHWPSHCQTAL